MPVEMAKDFAAIPGVYFSFTARSLGPREVRLVRSVPVERILVETDSPDQLPVELKGKMARNEMFVARMSCVRLAKAKEMEPVAFAIATAENARNVFDI
jgi:TatD DNase family protein